LTFAKFKNSKRQDWLKVRNTREKGMSLALSEIFPIIPQVRNMVYDRKTVYSLKIQTISDAATMWLALSLCFCGRMVKCYLRTNVRLLLHD